MTQSEQNLHQIQKFCQDDMKIKEILYQLAPDKNYLYSSEEYRIGLSDRMYEGLKEINYYLQDTLTNFGLESYKPHIDSLFEGYNVALAEASTNPQKLESFYKNNLSDMNPNIVKQTGETCVGYTFRENETLDLVNQTRTINELLHVIHSKIINDYETYQQLPKVTEMETQLGYPSTLYGKDTELARAVHACASAINDTGTTDLISLNNDQMIMMVRDKGHALTIQIERTEEDNFNVRYFIPKLCNEEMINHLKGVNPINENSTYTVGSFETSREALGLEILHFIANVPTDDNMLHWGRTEEEATVFKNLYQVFNEMDYSHLPEVIRTNPIVHTVNGFDSFIESKIENDYSSMQESLSQAIESNAPTQQIQEIEQTIGKIENASQQLGVEIEIEEKIDFEL